MRLISGDPADATSSSMDLVDAFLQLHLHDD